MTSDSTRLRGRITTGRSDEYVGRGKGCACGQGGYLHGESS